MFIKSVSLQNVRAFESFSWEAPKGDETGWHVLLGENGCGKSTLLRSIALALLPATDHAALRLDWSRWPRSGTTEADIKVVVGVDPKRDRDVTLSKPQATPRRQHTFSVTIAQEGTTWRPTGNASFSLNNTRGFFSASYGPFRRFSGGDPDEVSVYSSYPRVGAHLTVFNERYALSEALRWLRQLDHLRKDGHAEGRIIDGLIEFLNGSEMLPFGTRIVDVDSGGVWCVDGDGNRVPLEELSDGYRSLLSLTFELVRQLVVCYGAEALWKKGRPAEIDLPGVVLIDEIDAHLHPTWQHAVGRWFTRVFPRLQFIVTTHSPIVCQEATSIWKLSPPGDREPAHRLMGTDFERLRFGSILDAFGTGVFGQGVTRSEEGKARLQRLATLNAKDFEKGLTQREAEEREELRKSTPTASSRRGGGGVFE